MFGHLDDPEPFRPDQGFRSRVENAGRRRRTRARLAVGASTALIVLVAGLGLAATWTNAQLNRIERVDIDDSLLAAPDDAPGAPTNILVAGTDGFGDAAGRPVRTDTILVVRIDPSAGELRVLSIPRDLWVSLDGTDDRLNQAYATGGPDLLIDSVETSLGIEIDHYMEIGFRGVVDLVDLAGGVTVAVEAPVRDQATGLRLDAGCQHLDGSATLALLRSRRLERLGPDGWRPDTSGDLGRMARQQSMALLAPGLLSGIDNGPIGLARMVDAAGDSVVLDQTITRGQLLAWARWAKRLDQEDVLTATVPTESLITEGGANALRVSEPTGWSNEFLLGGSTPEGTHADAAPLSTTGPC